MSGLHVDSIIKSFGMRQLLTDCFISCHPGEIIGLLGRNGSGKSTLLKIIFGSMYAESRFVSIDGQCLKSLQQSCLSIKYLPQTNFLPNHITVRKMVDLYCKGENREQVLDHEFMRQLVDSKCGELSGGEKRLVEIVIILNADAQYVLLDEPFNGVAPVYKEEIKNIMRHQSVKKGLIITDHDYRNILDVATKIILMHDGGTKVIKHQDELEHWGYLNW